MMPVPPDSNQNDDPSENEDEGDEVDKAFAEFNARFPNKKDTEAFVKEMFRGIGGVSGIRCKHCNSQEFQILPGGRVLKCDKCNKNTWITAGSLYKNVKHVRAWVAAIWFLERGVAVAKNRFANLLEIAFSTAWEMFKRLSIVIESQMDMDALLVPSAYFQMAISKRSQLTPGRQHPFDEQAEAERLEAIRAGSVQTKPKIKTPEFSAFASDQSFSLEREIYEMFGDEPLTPEFLREQLGRPLREVLSAISMLEIQGLVAKVEGGYLKLEVVEVRSDAAQLSAEDLMSVGSYIKFVQDNFHGISRKYLQLFLAEYWCLMDRARWKIDSLLALCQRFRNIPDEEIQAYESPLLVQMQLES